MASLVLRGTTWHLAWRWRGKLKFKSTKVRHDGRSRGGKPVPPIAAKKELRKLEDSLSAGRNYETKTVDDLLKLVEKDYAVSGFRSGASLPSRVKHLRDWFGTLRADQLTETDLLEYAGFRQKDKRPAKNATINKELEMLCKAMKMAKLQPLDWKKLPVPRPRQGFFDETKMTSLQRKLPTYLRAPTLFAYYTGWRREEVFGLEVKDVDFVTGEVRLWESKNDKFRVFPMDVVPDLRSLLESTTGAIRAITAKMAQERVTAVTPLVFPRWLKQKKRFRRIVDFRKAWDTACTQAGCPGMIFHDLRRSAARNLELAGWPRSLVMEWMGHESESMFHRYRIVSAADREIVSKMLQERRAEEPKTLTAKA